MTLQFLYGIIPNIQGKGDCAKVSKYQSWPLSKNKHLDQLPKKYSNSIVNKYYCEFTVLTDYKLIECSKLEFQHDVCYK